MTPGKTPSRSRTRISVLLASIAVIAAIYPLWPLSGDAPESKPDALPSPFESQRPSSDPSSSPADIDASELIRSKPVEALRLATQLKDSSQRDELLHRSIAEWSTRDGHAALRWITKLEDPALRDELRAIALVQFACYDPAAASQAWAELLPQGLARTQALGPIYQRWAQQDPAAARASASALTDLAERMLALEHILRHIASEDPPAAIRAFIAEDLADHSPELLQELSTRWTVLDPSAAREWISSLAAGETRDRLLKQVAMVVARNEPQEAAQWILDSTAPGMTQDEALLAVLGEWLLTDIDAASRWAATFPPSPLRSQAEDEIQKAMVRRKPL